jgi:hypothetical protein
MICESCQGTGLGKLVLMRHPNAREGDIYEPCPDCIGGFTSCCDGLRASPEDEKDDAR